MRSSFFCKTGPEVVVKGTSISSAMMEASVVLPKPGRTVEQHVVQRLAANTGRLDGDGKVLFELALPRKIGETARTQARFELRLFGLGIA